MKFRVTEIEFDFDEDCTPGYKEDLICDTRTTVWDADNEDDLAEEITCTTGWCVKSLNYVHVL